MTRKRSRIPSNATLQPGPNCGFPPDLRRVSPHGTARAARRMELETARGKGGERGAQVRLPRTDKLPRPAQSVSRPVGALGRRR